MALGFGNSGSGGAATPGATASVSVFNNTNGVSILYVSYFSNGAYAQTSSITDASGGTWNLRKRVRFQSAWNGASGTANANYFVQETWWRENLVSTNRSLTLNIANNSSCVRYQWVYQCITGSTSTAAPWDTHASLPNAMQTYGNPGSTLAAISLPITTAQANSEILAFLTEETSTNGSTFSSTGTGMTVVNTQQDGVSPNQFGALLQHKTMATAGAFTTSASNNKQSFCFTADAISGTSTGSSASAGTTTMLSMHGTPVETIDTTGLVSSLSATITTTTPTVVIAVITTENFSPAGTPRTITGVSGGGLTWAKRSGQSGNFNASNGSFNQEVWWANATGSLTAQSITASFSGVPSQASDLFVFAVAGSPSPSSPWDANASLPAKAQSYTGSPTSMTKSGTTTSNNAMVLAFDSYAWNALSQSTIPTGYFNVLAPRTGTGLNIYWNYQNVIGAPGSYTATYGVSQDYWALTLDALTGDVSTATTGTIQMSLTKASMALAGNTIGGSITTTLTKASISAAGRVTATGAITTTLTKASISAAGNETFTGTVLTALTKVALAGTNAVQQFTGTITTTLTKVNIAATGLGGMIGTMATVLSGISQQATAPGDLTGTINTSLSKALIAASAREIFVGSAVTNINNGGVAIAIEADTFEVFVGTITTNLSPISISISALEEIIGHAATRLGGETGSMIANVAQAEVIVEGPIVMSLAGVRPLLLGAQLGTPGQAKWFSWRYTDA